MKKNILAALIALCIAAGVVVIFYENAPQKQWTNIGNDGGATLVRLPSIAVISKQDVDAAPPERKYQIRFVFAGGGVSEWYPTRDERDVRFREMSKLLGTLK